MTDTVPLSPDEATILQLYDQLQSLRLEIAILRAHREPQQPLPRIDASNSSDSVWEQMQNDVLSARAQLKLRDAAVRAVLTAYPILQAVHNGTDASPIERDLLPLVQRRDQAALSVAKHSSEMGALDQDLVQVQVEAARISRANVALAATLCELVDKQRHDEDSSAEAFSAAYHDISLLEAEVRSSRQRWRLIKGVASGIVVESGVDWTHRYDLLGMVLDADNDDDAPVAS